VERGKGIPKEGEVNWRREVCGALQRAEGSTAQN